MSLQQIFKILGNDDRLNIISALGALHELNVQQIEQITEIHQPTLSQQLTVLRKAKIVSTRRDGKQIFYSLSDNRTMDLVTTATKLFNLKKVA